MKATEAKMARGEMVRFMAERGVRDAEGLKAVSYTHLDVYRRQAWAGEEVSA